MNKDTEQMIADITSLLSASKRESNDMELLRINHLHENKRMVEGISSIIDNLEIALRLSREVKREAKKISTIMNREENKEDKRLVKKFLRGF